MSAWFPPAGPFFPRWSQSPPPSVNLLGGCRPGRHLRCGTLGFTCPSYTGSKRSARTTSSVAPGPLQPRVSQGLSPSVLLLGALHSARQPNRGLSGQQGPPGHLLLALYLPRGSPPLPGGCPVSLPLSVPEVVAPHFIHPHTSLWYTYHHLSPQLPLHSHCGHLHHIVISIFHLHFNKGPSVGLLWAASPGFPVKVDSSHPHLGGPMN